MGHSHPAIVEAMKNHLDGANAVNYVATIMFTSSPAEELSKLLLESWEPPLGPTEVQSTGKVYFCAGGKILMYHHRQIFTEVENLYLSGEDSRVHY